MGQNSKNWTILHNLPVAKTHLNAGWGWIFINTYLASIKNCARQNSQKQKRVWHWRGVACPCPAVGLERAKYFRAFLLEPSFPKSNIELLRVAKFSWKHFTIMGQIICKIWRLSSLHFLRKVNFFIFLNYALVILNNVVNVNYFSLHIF